jgi:protein SCO1/2
MTNAPTATDVRLLRAYSVRSFLLAAAALIVSLALTACSPHSNLPDLGSVPSFQLIAQDGQPFSSDALKDKVWVADFIFTTCSGPCPRMSSLMHRLQNRLLQSPALRDQVRMVSVTVDPAHDTPEVLAEYSTHFRARAGFWFFLSGPAESIQKLSVDTFHINTVASPLEHSSRLILVDRRARIRGYYESTDAAMLDQLVEDIGQLRKELF